MSLSTKSSNNVPTKPPIASSVLFDSDFYKANYKIPADIDPLFHYCSIGWLLCYDPSASFSTSGYLLCNYDVLSANVNPLVHYELKGRNENRKWLSTLDVIACSTYFDLDTYNSNIKSSSDRFSVNSEAAKNYITYGWKKNYVTSDKFDNILFMHEQDASLKECIPLLRYIVFNLSKEENQLYKFDLCKISLVKTSKYFNEEFYRKTYQIPQTINAPLHYLVEGWLLYYDPSPEFSTSGYLAANATVRKSGMNPLVHYELYGKSENRLWKKTKDIVKNSSLFDYKAYCAKYLFSYLDESKYEEWAINHFLTVCPTDNSITLDETENNNYYVSLLTKIVENKEIVNQTASQSELINDVENSSSFDSEWYRTKYQIPNDMNCAEHYVLFGYKVGCNPNENFCSELYIDENPDCIEKYGNPIIHYEEVGEKVNISTFSKQYIAIKNSGLFDEQWYRKNFMQSDIYRDAIVHYIKEGAYNGFPPSCQFSSLRYLIYNHDVFDSATNPLVHWQLFGKSNRDDSRIFSNIKSVNTLDIIEQNIDICSEYDKDTENLILFITPTSDSIGGGVMSINSIAKVSYQLTSEVENIKNYPVMLATYPSPVTFHHYTKFECAFNIYRFNQLRTYFTSLKNVIIHIPEVLVKQLLVQIKSEDVAWLHNIENLRINILNQNNDMMPRPYITKFLGALTDDVTMTCAHKRYCTPNQRSSYNIPVHMLSTSNLVEYKYKPYSEKEDILLYSPDDNDNKPAILKRIQENFPNLRMKMIKNLPYSEYLSLISRAKWMITFGEGLDGYAMESIRSGAISFATYNHTFFNERFEGLPNIYNSYAEMLDKIVSDIKFYDNQNKYKVLSDILIKKDREEKDEIRYRNNIKNYYLSNFTYPMKSLLAERKARLESQPLISIVMATYNGEKYLEKQLESLSNLTYANFELVISDDGSNDNTLSIIDKFTEILKIKLYINVSRHGATGNFENALMHANGEYIALCDQDDIWLPDHLEKLLYQIDQFDIIHGRMTIINSNGKYHPVGLMHNSYEVDKTRYTSVEDYLAVPRLLGCASLIKASAIKSCLPFPEEAPYHDWWITLKCLLDGNGICFTDELVIKYRQHGENTAMTEYKNGSRIEKQYGFMKYISTVYAEKLTPFQLSIIDRVENWCLLYPIFHDAAALNMDQYFGKHITDFSNEVIELIIKKYNEKKTKRGN